MAYFRCIGGSGGGATLTVTYSEEFYGATLTASNGSKTVTKVAPSTGSAEIVLPESGTWTVSATIEGETYTSKPVSVDLEYDTVLESIPNGSTVLPTDDIEMWLACAQIKDKAYTTLGEVLADTETLIALCADSNACDYMARSTTWALAEGLVPVMTSDTTPSGEAIASSYRSNITYPYKAFDGDNTTYHISQIDRPNSEYYLGYTFPSAKVVNGVKVCADSYTTSYYYDIAVYGGNSLSSLTKLSSNVRIQAEYQTYPWYTIPLNNSTAYSIYVIKIEGSNAPSSNGTSWGLSTFTLQFYPDADITTNSTAMLIVGKYNYCANALLGNSTWASAIVNSSYVDSVVDAKVPTMTSNTTPSGTAFCDNHSGYTTQHDAWMAFDGIVAAEQGKAWASSTTNSKVGYQFTTDVQISAVRIQCPANANSNELMNFKIQYSDDGTTFTDATPDALTFITAQPSTAQNKVYVIPACGYHPYWAILAISSYSNAAVIRVCEAQFYGRTDNANYIPLVPRMTSDTTPSGVVSSSSVYGNNTALFGAWRAFAYSTLTGVQDQRGWLPADGDTNPWVQYEFETHKIVNKWALTSYYGSGQKTFTLFGSNNSDFSNATELDTIQASSDSYATLHTSVFENNTAYKYYRVVITGTADTANKGIRCQFYRESDLPIIHSAVEDSIFYMDDGSPVALCGIPVGDTIDVDLEAYKGQTLTLVSTVAKDPTNLSNDFSMNVRITPNITEIYLMPIKSLYWWGYTITEATASSYRPSWTGTSFTAPTIANNKNDIGITQGNSYGSTFFNTPEITDDSITVNLVAKQSGGGDNTYQLTSSYENSYPYISNTNVNITQTSMTKYSQSYSGTSSRIIPVFQTNNSTLSIYALWLE